MISFQAQYHEFDAIWADCCIGYAYGSLSSGASSKAVAVDWFRDNTKFSGFASGKLPEVLGVTEQTLWEVDPIEGARLLETMLLQAVRYGSNARLPAGSARALAESFIAGFESPLLLRNFALAEGPSGPHIGGWRRVFPGHGYSSEALLVCLDGQHIGFLLSIENE